MFRDAFRKFVTNQFRKPSGLFGQIAESRMTKRTAIDATWTVSLLNIQSQSRILEIGFGGGLSTQLASEKAINGFVAGIDHSSIMVQSASKRNSDAIKAGRMELRTGDVASIPYPDQTFDIVFSLHSIYFWVDPIKCINELRRVLKPGGLLAITIQPKNRWRKEQIESPGINLYFGTQLVEMFASAGMQNIRIESYSENGEINLECILGIK